MQSPVIHFREVTRALENGRPQPDGQITIQISANAATWLHDGAVRFSTGSASQLCTALGLRGAGVNLPASQYAMQARDHHLSQAVELIEGTSRNQRCIALGHAIRSFEIRTWPRVCHEAEPPARLTDVQRQLFAAFKCCATVPVSRSQLTKILTK